MKYFLLACLLFVSGITFGQEMKSHPVLLSNGQAEMNPVATVWPSFKNDPDVNSNGKAFLLLQFRDLPGREEKVVLERSGIQLLAYVPNSTWMASVDENLKVTDLENLGVKYAGKLPQNARTPREMELGEIPYFAGNELDMKAKVLFWKEELPKDHSAVCAMAGLEVERSDAAGHWVEVRGSRLAIMGMAANPEVQFIEWPEPPIENEVLNELTLIQSNYISENPTQNLFFNGNGVLIAVNEGGIFDTLQSPNVKGRIDRSLESGNVSGHKTGVGMRMASAGNIDPVTRGTAWGADLQSGGINFANAAASGVSIVNNSFGYGCVGGSVTYNSGAANNDNLVRNNPGFMITYSAGNMGGSDCGYGAGPGWSNITGLVKSAKNIFAVGALGTNGQLTGFSSRGPAWDGRLLPDICTTGPGGTSHASPNLAGTWGQLVQAFRANHSGTTPESGLLKAIILNTADELENPGPDFKTGFGKVNARRAYRVIEQGNFITDTIAQGGTNTHTLNVPANLAELKVMVYWTDYEATPGIVSKALVNDLDASLQDPSAGQWLPWVLDPTPNPVTLDQNAVRGTDTLNNVEQITLKNPAAGNYSLTVNGTAVPQGPQTYFVVYEYVTNEMVITYPVAFDHFLPNTTERIRWETIDTSGTFDLSFSADAGQTWTPVASNLPGTDRYFDWTVPNLGTRQALLKIERGSQTAEMDSVFNIVERPQNLELGWSCADSSLFLWDSVPSATQYAVYRLGAEFMEFETFVTTNSIVLNNFSATEDEYIAVTAFVNGGESRRTIAISRPPQDSNCIQNDLQLAGISSPGSRYLPSCLNPSLTVLLKNNGTNAVSNIPVNYRIDGGTVQSVTVNATINSGMSFEAVLNPGLNLSVGGHLIETWTVFPGDPNLANDSIMDSVIVYSGTTGTMPFAESFDLFTNCSTAWGCASITCPLSQGWFNLPNLAGGDDIDWRTHSGATGTGGTGPAADHTTGSGKYLYLEGSGNGGSGCQNSTALLQSPCLDLTGTNQPFVSYWVHANGGAIGEMHLDVLAEDKKYEDVAVPVIGQQGNQWIQVGADLSAFVGQKIVLVFRGSTGGGFASDLAIDDISITSLPFASFSAVDTLVCLNQQVQFSNTSNFANSYAWTISPSSFSFQNGTGATDAQPVVAFSVPGNYNVQLIATSSSGADTSLQNSHITVMPATAPLFVDDPDTTYCVGDPVTLRTNFGPGTISWFQNGQFRYSSSDSAYTFTNVQDGDLLHLGLVVNPGCNLFSDTIAVTVNGHSSAVLNPLACGSYLSPGGQVLSQSGTFQDTIPNSGGCDSLITINLTLDTLTAMVTQTGNTLSANANATAYQWVDCANSYSPVVGETNRDFTPGMSGQFACVVSRNACTDTSDCVAVTISGLENELAAVIQIYPNPTSGLLTISSPFKVLEVSVTDVFGKHLMQSTEAPLQVESLASGVYFLQVVTEKGSAWFRFVRE